MDVRLNALKQASAGLAYLISVDMNALAGQLDARLIERLIPVMDMQSKAQ
jgi:hypothetical protein